MKHSKGEGWGGGPDVRGASIHGVCRSRHTAVSEGEGTELGFGTERRLGRDKLLMVGAAGQQCQSARGFATP